MNAHPLRVSRVQAVGSLQIDGDNVRKADHGLLSSVWSATAADMKRFVRAMGVDAGRADDVLQDVYLSACRQAPAAAGREDVRRWLFRVAANRCHLEHRRRGRQRRLLTALRETRRETRPTASAAELADRREQNEHVQAALARLTEQQRTLLVLRYFQEFDSTEIGRILDLPASTVRSQLRAARLQLARELKQAGYEND